MSLNKLAPLRNGLTRLKVAFLRHIVGVDLDPTVAMSLSAKVDLTFPKGVHVGEHTYLAFNSRILSHDRTRGLYVHTRVGANCFIGGESLILPGVSIGNNCILGAGSVVTNDVPDCTIVAGNPAKIIRENIRVGRYGRFEDADQKEIALRKSDPAAAALPDRYLGKN